jgi:hypothetical protein
LIDLIIEDQTIEDTMANKNSKREDLEALVAWEGMRNLRLSLVLSAAVLLLGAGSARAISFEFTSDHCTGGCGTPPFGDVTLTQNGTTVDVTVQLFSPNFFMKSGATNFQNFKFNATDVVLGDITVDQTVSPEILAAQTGAFNGDGTGMFAFGIACTTCANGAGGAFNDDIVFHVANATIADLTAGNNLGNIFVAGMLSDAVGGGTGNGGAVDVAVPETGTTALLGLGLVGLAVAGRRRDPRAARALHTKCMQGKHGAAKVIVAAGKERTVLLLVLGIVLLQRAPASALTIDGNSALHPTMGDAEITTASALLLGEQRFAGDAEPGRMISLPSETDWVQAVYEIALATSYEDEDDGGRDPINMARRHGLGES